MRMIDALQAYFDYIQLYRQLESMKEEQEEKSC